MTNCSSCGMPIPDGQGSSCSMCYGDISHGSDGYYEEWARQQESEEMTKQNDMPEDYASLKEMPPKVLADRVVETLILAKGNLVMYQAIIQKMIERIHDDYRADKPADNGGDVEGCKCLHCEHGFGCENNKFPEVSGEVDIEELKHEMMLPIEIYGGHGNVIEDQSCVIYNKAVVKIIDHLASRNLLKSEGVYVPDKVIEKVEQYLELILNSPKNPDGTPWINGGMSSVEEIVEKALEALRPFLPAEKE